MRKASADSIKRIAQLEKQIGNKGDTAELFQKALSEVLQEATDEELRTAAGSGKFGKDPAPDELFAMHELFRSRAERKVNQYRDEKGKNHD
ncbi:Hypothetical protein TPAS_517 [Trichococcus pasteurii]|uniref:Uncharacterized protein n=2 Tax=Trichococcus pasteurii TaxID=43064 RepID=A0A1W1ICX3_9LACT|nr:hypothetical protein SAMN04488086_10363 [Trichococcus pasteurii]SLM50845.1 Hypothetical protein TPAS_517 [Trichococcus pasteurii]SSB91726.1 Hypothetical protein TPAS_517 [Trichococcus pasteurii]